MQNLRKNKNKVITTQMMNLTNEEAYKILKLVMK